jgi:hypothetical protein
MSEATYTPGPWSQEHRIGHDGFYNTEVFDAAGETIATLAWYPKPTVDGVTGTYREGNARLIAAAPDLLAELERTARLLMAAAFVITHDESRAHAIKTVDSARALIAKVSEAA